MPWEQLWAFDGVERGGVQAQGLGLQLEPELPSCRRYSVPDCDGNSVCWAEWPRLRASDFQPNEAILPLSLGSFLF